MTKINQTPPASQALKAQQAQFIKAMAVRKKGAVSSDPKGLATATAELKTRHLEVMRQSEAEAKKTFVWQSGIRERAAAHGFDLEQLQYEGRPLTELTPEEASALVAEDGYFGVTQTAQRLAGFVIDGGGDDRQRVQAGREGIVRGFSEAEKIWGGKLPEISYQTLAKALEKIDARLQELDGGAVVDVQA